MGSEKCVAQKRIPCSSLHFAAIGGGGGGGGGGVGGRRLEKTGPAAGGRSVGSMISHDVGECRGGR